MGLSDPIRRQLARDRDELGFTRDELTDSLAELHREPRAALELTEAELEILVRGDVPLSALGKFRQALALEQGHGGKFS